MKVEDVYAQNQRLWVPLREKGRKCHGMPCHQRLEEHFSGYLDRTGLAADPKGPLFRTIGRGTGDITTTPPIQQNAHAVIRRRLAAAGIATKARTHSSRATRITAGHKEGVTP
jgi:hypothetical protein